MTTASPGVSPDLELGAYKAAVDAWLDQHEAELAPSTSGIPTMDEELAQLVKVRQLAFDSGWSRLGWPERVGGLGGSTLLRAYLGEVLTARDLVEPGFYCMPEILVPTMLDYAPAELAAAMVPPLLRGRRNVVSGLLRTGQWLQPGVVDVPGGGDR